MTKNVNNDVSKDSPTPKERNERHPEKPSREQKQLNSITRFPHHL